jgi:hypothetical protein
MPLLQGTNDLSWKFRFPLLQGHYCHLALAGALLGKDILQGTNDNNAPARVEIKIFKKGHLSLAGGALLENDSLH